MVGGKKGVKNEKKSPLDVSLDLQETPREGWLSDLHTAELTGSVCSKIWC